MKKFKYKKFNIKEKFRKPEEIGSNFNEIYNNNGLHIFVSENLVTNFKFSISLPYSYENLKEILLFPETFNFCIQEIKVLKKLYEDCYLIEEVWKAMYNGKNINSKFSFLCMQVEKIKNLKIYKKSIPSEKITTNDQPKIEYYCLKLKNLRDLLCCSISGNIFFERTKSTYSDLKYLVLGYIKEFEKIRSVVENYENHQINLNEGIFVYIPTMKANLFEIFRANFKTKQSKLKISKVSLNPINQKNEKLEIELKYSVFYSDYIKLTDFGELIGQTAGEVRVICSKQIEWERNLLFKSLKTIGKSLLSGKSLINVQLPIEIFCTITLLEIQFLNFRSHHYFFQNVINSKNSIDAINHIVGFILCFTITTYQVGEPLLPILGDTFQGYINDSTYYSEQISIIPPFTSILIVNKDYKLYGSSSPNIYCSGNSFQWSDGIKLTLEISKSNKKYKFTIPILSGSGLLYGNKRLMLIGRIPIVCEEDNLVLDLQFFNSKKSISDYFETELFELHPNSNLDIKVDNKEFKGINRNLISRSLGRGNGIYHSHYDFNDKRYYDNSINYKTQYRTPKVCLPSDSQKRIDSIHWKNKNVVESQKAKDELENNQLKDRNLREIFLKVLKK